MSLTQGPVAPGDDLSHSSTSSTEVGGLMGGAKLPRRCHALLVSSDESLEMIDDEILDEGHSVKPQLWQSCSVSEWGSQQVGRWLVGLTLEQYVPQFSAKAVDGAKLLQLDSAALKALGVTSTQDRALIKKKLKDLKVLMEKARRNREKMEKQKEKLLKKEQEQLQKQARKCSKPSGPDDGAAE